MIMGLVAFQAAAGLLVIMAEPLKAQLPLRQWLAAQQAAQLLAGSIDRNASGTLIFQPTPEMADYLARTPAFWFLASDGSTLLRGGEGGRVRFKQGADGEKSDQRGTVFRLDTAGGSVAVLLGGQQGGFLDGIRAWLGNRLWLWLMAVAVVSLCTTVVTIGLVRWLLRPVNRAAAAALAAGQDRPALPEAGVPAEILPLVSATNDAFDRLANEHDRQRRFMANAAHELRTPIAILNVRLDELPETPVKLRLRQDVKRLATLADQLLDLERLRHAEPRHDQMVDLVALGRRVVAEMGPLAVDGGNSLEFRTELPRLDVRGDEQALRSVLLNLISNALSHGGQGVDVELRVGADGVIEVADSGMGVPAEVRERVFEAFQRGGGNGGGAGLGLYIVREVLRVHGAQIELRDGAPGAVFQVRFPRGKWAPSLG